MSKFKLPRAIVSSAVSARHLKHTDVNYVDIDSRRNVGNPNGNPQNLIPCRKKVGKLTSPPTKEAVLSARQDANERVADAVAGVLHDVRCSVRHIGRLLQRDMSRTIHQLLRGSQDTTISTLSDIAAATGKRLEIRFVDATEADAKAA